MDANRVTLAVVGALAALLIAAAPAAARPDPEVRVATSGDRSELIDRLPIARGERTEPRVVLSIPVRRVGGVDRGDALAVSAELQLTTDCDEPGQRCLGDPYHYNPRVTTYAILATSRREVGGGDATMLAGPKQQTCRQAQPYREHHCVLVREPSPRRIGAGAGCTGSRCFVNLIAAASSPRAHRGELMAVGGLRPNGSVPQDRARINLVRFSPAGIPEHRTAVTSRLLSRELSLDQERGAVLAGRLRGLEPGEQLVVGAEARVDISRLPYNVVLSSQLIVTDRRGDLVRGRGASFVSSRGELDEGNGFNCTQNRDRCTIRKVGVLTVKRTPRTASGKPMPLFVSLVTRAGPKQMPAAAGDRVRLVGGRLRVTRYPNRARHRRAIAGAGLARKPERGSVAAVMTGKHAEIREVVPIASRRGQSPRSVLSVRLPDLDRGSRISFNGEVTLSTTCVEPGPRCIGRSYGFDPHLRARVVLSRRAGARSTAGTVPVSRPTALTCEQTRPNRNHHCPFVIDTGGYTVERLRALPCPSHRCRLNLLVDAWSHHARHRQVVVVGADRPDGSVEGGKARLSAAVAKGAVDIDRRRTRRLRTGRLQASFDGGKEVVYSQRMGGLRRGDVLLVRSRQVSRITGMPNFVSDTIVIGTRPGATEPAALARRVVSRNGTATETNGFNCTLGRSAFSTPCVGRKAGLAVIERDPRTGGGRRKPLYVNLVSRGFPKLIQARGYPAVQLGRDGFLEVTRLRADR